MPHIIRDYRNILPGIIRQSDTCRQREHPTLGKQRPHNGVDLAADPGSPIFAPRDGEVVKTDFDGKDGGFGHYLVLKHPGPDNTTVYTIYAHLENAPDPESGSPIKAGQQIASSGIGGTGPHLHYEERIAVPDANENIPTWDKAWPLNPDRDLTGMSGNTVPPNPIKGSGLFNPDPCMDDIPPAIADDIAGAENFIRRRDPLTFDLDGDGIETVGIDPNNPILFDHDGDGLKTATGWVKADDAFLVLDRNGNGTIDNGTELFGDSTPLLLGGNAADGFAALQDQDTNGDGQVNANDANFSQLRLWQDLNQNGIAAIHVGKTENSTLLPKSANRPSMACGPRLGPIGDGNVIVLHRDVRMPRAQDAQERPDLGHYTRTDGTVGGIGDIGHLGDVDLTSNTFFSQFTDAIPITPEADALPNMHGSGQVRDWQQMHRILHRIRRAA